MWEVLLKIAAIGPMSPSCFHHFLCDLVCYMKQVCFKFRPSSQAMFMPGRAVNIQTSPQFSMADLTSGLK
jgi:hypothetical protein